MKVSLEPSNGKGTMRHDPTSSLAAETLAHIFTITVQTPKLSQEICRLSLVLSSVCHRWRTVALSTPALWSNILIGSPSLGLPLLNHIQLWLQRSHAHPLRIYIDARDPDWDWDESAHCFNDKEMEQILSLICPHFSRWESLDVLADTWSPIHTFLCRTSKFATSALRRLSLSRCNAYLASTGQHFTPEALKQPIGLLIGGAPRLEELSLVGVHVEWSRLRLSNLTELELKYHAQDVTPSIQELAHMLNASANLERLTILGWGTRSCTVDDKSEGISEELSRASRFGGCEGVVHLPKLSVLTFGWLDASHACMVLSLFSLPSLLTLTLENVGASLDHDVFHDDSPILEFAAGTAPSDKDRRRGGIAFYRTENLALRSLRTTGGSNLYLRFLSAFRNVTQLELHSPENELLSALSTPSVPLEQFCAEQEDCTLTSLPALPCQALSQVSFSDVDSFLVQRFLENRLRFQEPISILITTSDTDDDAEDCSLEQHGENTAASAHAYMPLVKESEEFYLGSTAHTSYIDALEAVNGLKNEGEFDDSVPKSNGEHLRVSSDGIKFEKHPNIASMEQAISTVAATFNPQDAASVFALRPSMPRETDCAQASLLPTAETAERFGA
jgi:hypothetical protein